MPNGKWTVKVVFGRDNIVPGYATGSQERHYAERAEANQQAWSGTPEQPFIPEVTAGRDKRPWEGDRDLGQKL